MSDEIEEVGKFFERGSCEIRANALSARPFDDSCIIIRHTFPSERKTKFDGGESFTYKFSPALWSFQLQFWKIFLQLHAVLQQSLGFKCNLLFSLCFLLKKNVHNEVLSYLVI